VRQNIFYMFYSAPRTKKVWEPLSIPHDSQHLPHTGLALSLVPLYLHSRFVAVCPPPTRRPAESHSNFWRGNQCSSIRRTCLCHISRFTSIRSFPLQCLLFILTSFSPADSGNARAIVKTDIRRSVAVVTWMDSSRPLAVISCHSSKLTPRTLRWVS
jgi:hypothetical protein